MIFEVIFLNFIKLEILILIYKYNKVTAVAERLGIKQPTVTFHMKSLEKMLGVKLFETHGGYIVLTEPGQALMHYADKILKLKDEAERAVSEFNDLKKGTLKIGASYVPSTYLIPDILRQIKNVYSMLEISVTINPSKTIVQMLLDHELDVGIICSMGNNDSNLVYKKIYEDELGVVFSTKNSLIQYKILSEENLWNQTFVNHSKVSSTRQLVEKWLEKRQIKFSSVVQLDSLEAIKHTIASTDWVSIISKKAVEQELKRGELVYRALPGEGIKRDIYLVYNRDRWVSPIMQKFFDVAVGYNANK